MSTVPNQKFIDGLHTAQSDVLEALDAKRKRFFMLKWHRRARKTTLIINTLIRACCLNKKKVYPYVGPTYRQAKNIIWRDPNMLFTYLPPQNHRQFGWEKNESELYIKFKTGCVLPIKGGDDPDTLRGIDADGIGFDEWAMMKHEIWTEIFRPIIAQDVNRWAMFAYTPQGWNHATAMWREAQEWEEWYTSELKASMSGLLTQAELDKARREMPPFLYDQEFECADITDEELTLITSRLLDNLPRKLEKIGGRVRRIVACDPDASVNGDLCVIYAIEDSEPVDDDIFHERDSMKIGARVNLMMERHGINDAIVDSIGAGNGVIAYLNSIHKRVMEFDSREKAIEEKRFANKRAEAWWHVMKQMMDGEILYPAEVNGKPKEAMLLRQDLSSVRVKPGGRHGRILLEDKVLGTKKRLGRSPDRGDAYVMGNYGLQFVNPEEPGWQRTEDEEPKAAESYAVIRSEF